MQDAVVDAPLDPDILIAVLRGPSPHYKRVTIDAIVEHREVMAPRVLALLREPLAVPNLRPDHTREGFEYIYALALAVHLRPPGTHEALLALARFDEALFEWLFGGYLTEGFDRALFLTAEGDAEGIRALLGDRSAVDYLRCQAADALALMVGAGQLDRAEVAGWVAAHMSADEAEAGGFLWSGLCSTLARLWPGQHQAVVDEAFAEGRIDRWHIAPGSVEGAIGRGVEAAMERLEAGARAAQAMGVHDEVSWWACFDAARRVSQPVDAPSGPPRSRKRVDRKKQAKQRKKVRAQRRKARERKR